jgi:hypothetical protein
MRVRPGFQKVWFGVSALAGKAVRITIHDDGLIKNANGHSEAGPMPDFPSQPELGRAHGRRAIFKIHTLDFYAMAVASYLSNLSAKCFSGKNGYERISFQKTVCNGYA